MNEMILSVSEVNNIVKESIDCNPSLNSICVRGELSNYKIYPSGHHYFTLKDSDSSLKCVMFKSASSKLRFKPENGQSVIIYGRISVYPRDGAYQLYANFIIPAGIGDLQLAFEQLKKQLGSEGLFDVSHKKVIPKYPDSVAIITSASGAAVHDMIRILGTRWPLTKIKILSVRVQGKEAPAEIAGAIRYVNNYNIADVIITGRGGGSIEDLWAFNDERVARAIYNSKIPIISAVGHEPDVTISDYVADLRASTPSNAAELLVPDSKDIYKELNNYKELIYQLIQKNINTKRKLLLELSKSKSLHSQIDYINNMRMQIDSISSRLDTSISNIISDNRYVLAELTRTADALSPLKVLTRGYSIVEKDNVVITSVKNIYQDDYINIKMQDGTLECKVEYIKEN